MVAKKANNPKVQDYLDKFKGALKPLLLDLRKVVHTAVPSLEEAIKWGNCLTFSHSGKNIIQTVVGKEHITLIFFQGAKLEDPKGLLVGDGKTTRSVRFTDGKFDAKLLQALVKRAVLLEKK